MNALPENTLVLRAALDRLNEIESAMRGAVDLLHPPSRGSDLYAVDRGNVAMLFQELVNQYAATKQQAWAAFQQIGAR